MGKQTESNKNKSSKKNYSFTGHRIIGENKATHLAGSESDSNTTDDMRQLLESDHVSNNRNMMAQPENPMIQQQMNQMPMMMQQPPMPQPQMNPFMMNQSNSKINQFMGADVDPLMVNTLAPVNNMGNNFGGFDGNGLMNSSQMAQNLSGFANLAQLNPNGLEMANQYANNAMSETNMMGMNMMNNMNNMGMNMMNNMNMMGMNNMDMSNGYSKSLDPNSLKNLSNLYSMNIIKQ